MMLSSVRSPMSNDKHAHHEGRVLRIWRKSEDCPALPQMLLLAPVVHCVPQIHEIKIG